MEESDLIFGRNEYEPLTASSRISNDDGGSVKVYRKRWYILAMFFALSACQGIMYNTWAPIQRTARAVYGWDNWVIDLMPALGCVAPCFTILPIGWLMDVKGLRVAVLLAAFFQFIGAALRCIPTGGNWQISTVLICFGQAFSGMVAPVPLSGGVLLSATWFPSNERITSTAIASAGSSAGYALSFIIGPLLVDDVGSKTKLDSVEKHSHFGQIKRLLWIEAGITAVLFLGIAFYYPAQPHRPPSRSSGVQRLDFKRGLKRLSKNPNFISLALLYGVSCGVYSGWNAVLDQNLSEFGLSQRWAGWLGFIAIVSGACSGIFFSSFAGRFSGHLKEFLVVFMAFATFSTIVTNFIFDKVIPFNILVLCIVFGSTGFFVNGALPFFFELGAEMAYPVAEGIASSVIKFMDFFLQAIFLIVSMRHFGAKWMMWINVVTCAGTTLLLVLVKEKYNRLAVDVRPNALQVNQGVVMGT